MTSAPAEYKQGFKSVFSSELIKFTTLKTNIILLVSTCLSLILFGVLAVAALTGNAKVVAGGPVFATRTPIDTVMSGANFAVLLISVLSVLLGAREYSSGMIYTTLAAVPRRLPVLWAKTCVFILFALPFLALSAVIVFSIGTFMLSNSNLDSATWADPGVARAVFGTAVNMVGLGVMGIALGFLMRSVAAGIGVLIGGILVLPSIAGALLPESWVFLLKYTPANAGASFTILYPTDGMLDPAPGLLVFFAWVFAVLIAAAFALKKRDA